MDKGISLITLVLTVIIMLILASITVFTGNIIEKAQFQEICTNMQLIKSKVNIIKEKVLFEGEQSKTKYYIGIKLKEQEDKAELAGHSLNDEELEDENYYIYNQDVLNSIGLNAIKLEENDIYIVNYNTQDVIYPNGCKDMDENIVYRLSEMME